MKETTHMESLTAVDMRLKRIEDKLDKLSDVVIALARAEEKLVFLDGSNKSAMEKVTQHEVKLNEVSVRVSRVESSHHSLVKLFWMTLSAAITGLISYIFLIYGKG